jgi:penicillin-binding protein A
MYEDILAHLSTHVLKFITLGSMALFLLQALRAPRAPLASTARNPSRAIRLTFLIILLPLFVMILLYQATWQLTGFARPKFVAFMRTYNRRDVNAARTMHRGRILDQAGKEIARNRPEQTRSRVYPSGGDFSHLVGFVHPVYGIQGLERAEDAWLSGRHFAPRQDMNRFARNILDRTQITGSDLQITADARLQQRAMEMLKGKRGAVVAIRPSDGSVLVLASSPAFDPNQLGPELFENTDAQQAPLLNRALHGLYPPGSTFKMLIASLAIEQGFNRKLDCPAEGFIPSQGARPIRDHAYYIYQREGRAWQGYGTIGLREAFAQSSNVFFARLGIELGAEALNAASSKWLFGHAIPLQGMTRENLATRPGRMPQLKPGERQRTAQLSIGQGEMLITPMQMAVLTAAIANDGIAMRPRITPSAAVAQFGTVTTPDAAAQVRQLMRDAVQSGTGRRAALPHLEIAGKTGTAQVTGAESHSWFICFAPYDTPTLAVAVIVEHGGYGSAAALPIATAILEYAQTLGLLSPPRPTETATRGSTP